MARLLGVDLGTTSISALLYDDVRRDVLAYAGRPHEAYVSGLPPGHREQDPARYRRALAGVLADVAATCDETVVRADAVSVTGQMHGCILLGKRHEPLSRFLTWEDSRAAGVSPSGTSRLRELARRRGSDSGPEPGTRLAAGYAGATLFVLHEQGELPRGLAGLALPPDWLATELCGRREAPFLTDPTSAQASGIYLPVSKRWDPQLLELIGIDEAQVPEVAPVGSRFGVTGAADLPIQAGIPVYVGLGDNQASFLAAVAEPGRSVLFNVGTGGQVSVQVSQPRPEPPNIDLRLFPGDAYLLVGASLCGGRAHALFAELIADVMRTMGADAAREQVYERIEALADVATPVQADVRFSGTRDDPDVRGAFRGIDADHLSFGDLAGAVVRGIAEELVGMYETMDAPREVVVGAGNGVRRSGVLREALRRCTGREPAVSTAPEEAALGAALVAGLGVGVFANVAEAAAHARLDRREGA
jgi:sugar (pentulose or hexulose) kinase